MKFVSKFQTKKQRRILVRDCSAALWSTPICYGAWSRGQYRHIRQCSSEGISGWVKFMKSIPSSSLFLPRTTLSISHNFFCYINWVKFIIATNFRRTHAHQLKRRLQFNWHDAVTFFPPRKFSNFFLWFPWREHLHFKWIHLAN